MCMVFAVAAIVADIAFVDPLIGTGSKREVEGDAGGMMPYVGVPFGMWQWVPMTRLSEHGVTSFSPVADGFLGFVATRQPAPWMGDFGPISLIAQATEEPVCDYAQRKVSMVKDQCVYTPYYAKVVTADGVISEVTASSRAAMLRFTFPKGAKRRIVFDASRVFRGHFSSDVKQPGGISFGSFFSSRSAVAWNTDRADSIAHPFSPCKMKFFNQSEKEEMLASITDTQLGDIMTKGEKAGSAWELHKSSVMCFPDFYRRFYFVGKEAGVHFCVGTDAHHLKDLDTSDFAVSLKEILK